MAQFNVDGTDELIEDMRRYGELCGQTADKMLLAGAEIVRQEWRKSAEAHDHRDTGRMIETIDYSVRIRSDFDGRSIEIGPTGNDRNRRKVRNATKAFVTNYGVKTNEAAEQRRRERKRTVKIKGKGLPGTHWVEIAEQNAERPVLDEWNRIWAEYLGGR